MAPNYLMQAKQNYAAAQLAIIAAAPGPYANLMTWQSFTGDSFDAVRRRFVYGTAVEHTAPVTLPYTIWDGAVAITAGDPVDEDQGHNFFTLVKDIDSGAVSSFEAYNVARMVPAGIGGGDGTWRRNMDTFGYTSPDQGQLRRLIDPRTGNMFQHTYGVDYPCGLYLLRNEDDYQQIISPVTFVEHMELSGLSDDWLHLVRGDSGTVDVMLVPRTITADETTADRLLEYATFDAPDEFDQAHWRGVMGPNGSMWYVTAKWVGTREYTLWKFEEPTSAPYGGPTVGGGFTNVTPWTSSTGPNDGDAPSYALFGFLTGGPPFNTGRFNKTLMYMFPRVSGDPLNTLAIITKLMPGDKTFHSRDPLLMQWDCTYYDTGTADWETHAAFLTGYMKADWTPTADINEAAYSVIDVQEVNKYQDFNSYDFSQGDDAYLTANYSRRWFFFTVQKVVAGSWTFNAADNHTVIVQYEFAYGSPPTVTALYDEDLWFANYAYTGFAHPMNTCMGALQNYEDTFYEWGLYDPETRAWWWGAAQTDLFFAPITAMGVLDPNYADRDTDIFSGDLNSSYPFLRIAIAETRANQVMVKSNSRGRGHIRTPVTPPTPTPPTPPAPPPTDYPASVVQNGLQLAWNYQTRAAPVPPKIIGADTLPAGAALASGVLTITAACTLDGWDLRGVSIYRTGAFAATISNSLIRTDLTDYTIRNGPDEGVDAGTLNLTGCAIDCSSPTTGWGGIVSRTGSTLNLTNCNLTNANTGQVITGGGAISGCYFGSLGQNCPVDAHIEQVYLLGGTHVISGNLFDARGGILAGGWTANVFASGGDGANSITFSGNIAVGAAECGGNYAFQARSDTNDYTWGFTGNVVAPGTSGYLGRTPAMGGTVTASTNIDFDTSASIDAAILAS